MQTPLHSRFRMFEPPASRKGYTLTEIIVTITIIAVLAIMLFGTIGLVRKKARAAIAMASMRQVASFHTLYSNENNGAINFITIRDFRDATQPANHFWGRFQTYFVGDLPGGWNPELNTQYKQALNAVLGTSDCVTMAGTAISGAKIYPDNRGLPIPFCFNAKVYVWDTTKLRKMSEFREPSQMVYMTYGYWTFNTADGSVHADFNTDGAAPIGPQKIYSIANENVVAAFLDGRVESIKRPFDPLYYGQFSATP